jgi:RNA polymerase sigma-70 factor (ECF subfamily)
LLGVFFCYDGAWTKCGALKLATERELSDFLIQVERRAFKQAMYAVRDEHGALDIVQDAMLKLAEKYGARPAEELPPLFQRILQNTIHDYFRRHKVRAMWTTLLSSFSTNQDGEDQDPLETLEVESDSNHFENPSKQLEREQTLAIIEDALKELPARQREAFLLRYWEDMDVAETAAAMGCSDGSVKTHCSRAVHALAAKLKTKGVRL